jgi:hypothetical protein
VCRVSKIDYCRRIHESILVFGGLYLGNIPYEGHICDIYYLSHKG